MLSLIRSTHMSALFFESKCNYVLHVFCVFFRMDHFLSTNSILLLAGSFVSLLDLICFYVHCSIQRYDGARGRLNCIGAALPMSSSSASSHSEKITHHISSLILFIIKFSCKLFGSLSWNKKKKVREKKVSRDRTWKLNVVVGMNSSSLLLHQATSELT